MPTEFQCFTVDCGIISILKLMQVILIDDFPCPPPFDGWTREIDIFFVSIFITVAND